MKNKNYKHLIKALLCDRNYRDVFESVESELFGAHFGGAQTFRSTRVEKRRKIRVHAEGCAEAEAV